MKIGFVGCGKLGLMVALTIESRGHEVKGYDPNPAVAGYLRDRAIPFKEDHAEDLLARTKMEMVSLTELCAWADILFLAPQTPHDPRYEGITPIPEERVDFDYSFLKQCVQDVNANLVRRTTCVVISTVLPGTIEREVLPLLGPYFGLVYEPLFIAMGTVYHDFLKPEFVLVGTNEMTEGVRLYERGKESDNVFMSYGDLMEEAAAGRSKGIHSADIWHLIDFYKTIHSKKLFITDIRTAEGIKVFYNTFITAKTVLANLYGEMAHKLGMNVDDIFKAISLSTDRLLSPKYLQAGMGDGGGCHPRDNIALSYVARRENVSFDFFEALMTARERHAEWLAQLIIREAYNVHRVSKLAPIYILGRSFKPETNIEAGSPSLLLSSLLQAESIPHEIVEDMKPTHAGVYFIGTKHERYKRYRFPQGSTVIDPFRYIEPHDHEGVNVISIGAGPSIRKAMKAEALA